MIYSNQRAFYREFGCNPREYSQNPIPIYLFTPYGIKSIKGGKEKTMTNVKTIFIQTLEKPHRRVLIKRGVKATDYFAYCEEEHYAEAIHQVWEAIKKLK